MVADSTQSRCVCPRGYMPSGQNACRLCNKGYYCLDEQELPCPMHQYQDMTGASSCKECQFNDAGAAACPENQQMQICTPRIPATQSRALQLNCVPCSLCVSLFYFRTLFPQYVGKSIDEILAERPSGVTFCYKR